MAIIIAYSGKAGGKFLMKSPLSFIPSQTGGEGKQIKM
jgi:hypothetical protein